VDASATHEAASLGNVLTAAVIAAVVGGLGWIAAYLLTGIREDRTKRLQLTIEHASTQIKEFYAPLMALTDQLDTTATVKESVVGGTTPNRLLMKGLNQ
jgi:hypothetical protein